MMHAAGRRVIVRWRDDGGRVSGRLPPRGRFAPPRGRLPPRGRFAPPRGLMPAKNHDPTPGAVSIPSE
jgi:hypothetical protein